MTDMKHVSHGLLAVVLFALASGGPSGCACGPGPTTTPTNDCIVDADCPPTQVCNGGVCSLPVVVGEPDVFVPEPDAGITQGELSVNDDEVEFGAAQLGTTVERHLVLENVGTAPLTVQQVFINDDPSGEFSVSPDGTLDEVLHPQETYVLTLTHTPLDGEADFAELFIVHDGPDSPMQVGLIAEFKGTSGLSLTVDLAQLTPDVMSIDMGNVPIGAEQEARVYIRNDGTSDSLLRIEDAYLTPAMGPFSLEADTPVELEAFDATCIEGVVNCPGSGNTCLDGICVDADGQPVGGTMAVLHFTPTDDATVYATLSIEHDEAGVVARRDISLVGQGVEGSILATPGTLVFDGALVNEEVTRTVRLTNISTSSVTLQSLRTDVASPFSAFPEFPVPRTLAPDEFLDVDITFSPTMSGDFTDELEVQAEGEPLLRVRLDGRARLPGSLLIEETAIAFGDVYEGTAASHDIRIRNDGEGPLTIQSMGISGPNASRFGLSPPSFPQALTPLPSPDAQNPAFVLSVYYTAPSPITNVEDAATLYIRTDDPEQPELLIPLSGNGIRPVLSSSQTTVDFGEADVFTALPTQTLTLSNTGSGPLIISSVSVDGDAGFTATPGTTLPATLLPSSPPLSVQLEFTPGVPGDHEATLTVVSNDLGNASQTITLQGRGKVCDALPGATFVQTGPNCAYSCADGFVDLDDDLAGASSNGCEYECSFVDAVDLPDDNFVDANCDGIDGMVDQHIFVDGEAGSDSFTNPGTIDAPFATVSAAILNATMGDVILVGAGTYAETLQLRDGVSIHGGYLPESDWARSSTTRPNIQGDNIAVYGNGITTPTSLSYLEINASDGGTPGAPSIGIHVVNAPGLELRQLHVTAGNGAAGSDGQDGTDGDAIRAAVKGSDGSTGCSGGGCGAPLGFGGLGGAGCTAASNGGRGGTGGYSDADGADGDPGNGTGGALGEGGATNTTQLGICNDASNAVDGDPGDDGDDGTDGTSGSAEGGFFMSAWVPANGVDGDDGSDGAGGGGGGGGGGAICNGDTAAGGGGGGGGGGGCGGLHGTGGGGGGASFAILLVGSNATVTSCVLTAGDGGSGGSGGSGGAPGNGGNRGLRGAKVGLAGRGGYGGAGGDGGRGGHGGGGGGGPSHCLYRAGGSAPTLSNLTYVAGSGGMGGASEGNAGANGLAGGLR